MITPAHEKDSSTNKFNIERIDVSGLASDSWALLVLDGTDLHAWWLILLITIQKARGKWIY